MIIKSKKASLTDYSGGEAFLFAVIKLEPKGRSAF